jgi:hypothetical protein
VIAQWRARYEELGFEREEGREEGRVMVCGKEQ